MSDPFHHIVHNNCYSSSSTTQPTQIYLFRHIFRCSGRMKAISSDIESSHCALSISGGIEAKYQSFVKVLNSRGVYFGPSSARSTPKFCKFEQNRNELPPPPLISTSLQSTAPSPYGSVAKSSTTPPSSL